MGSYPSWALVIMNSVSKAQRTCRLLALIAFLSSPSSEEVDRSSPKISSWASPLGEPVSDLDRLRIEALGGFGPSQARPQQAPIDGAALVALAGGSHRQALCWAALMMSMPQGYWSG